MLYFRRALAGLLLVGILSSFMVVPTAAQTVSAPSGDFAPEASAAILLEVDTDTILYELNADQQIPPASLTKLMTLWLASKAIREGHLDPAELVQVTTDAWAANPVFAGASNMFLEPGMKVTVQEIMQGIAIASGNDAAVALAQHMNGTVAAFVAEMNREATALGLHDTHFVDPHGLSPSNLSTARDMLRLAALYINTFPENLPTLHAQHKLVFPQEANWSDIQRARGGERPHELYNYNRLLFDGDLQVDGLKTGYLPQSGYNFAVTATEGRRRLLGILFGTKSEEHRAAQGKALLLYGFRNFTTVTPVTGQETFPAIKVWKGAADSVKVSPAHDMTITVPRSDAAQIQQTSDLLTELTAPVASGQKVGTILVQVAGKAVGSIDLITTAEVPKGGFFKRLMDSIKLFIGRLRGLLRKG